MSKKHFISLADCIRVHNKIADMIGGDVFSPRLLDVLSDWCKSQDPRFNRERWLAYVAGKCGPNGGTLRK